MIYTRICTSVARKLLTLGIAVIVPAIASAPFVEANDKLPALVGSWKLLSWKHKQADGSLKLPMGETPVGLLVYDSLGNISVQIMDDFRPVFEAGFEQTTLDELKSVYSSYMALFGSYTVNTENRTIYILVKGITNPNYLSAELTRYYRLEGNILSLSLDKQGHNKTVWKRIENAK